MCDGVIATALLLNVEQHRAVNHNDSIRHTLINVEVLTDKVL